MRRKVILGTALLLLLVGVGTLAWTILGWPPPRFILKYGFNPGCEPTGETMSIEGIEFVEISGGCYRMGSDYLASSGDTLGRLSAVLGLPWGDQPTRTEEMPIHWVELPDGFWIAKTEVTNEQYSRFLPDWKKLLGQDLAPVTNVSWSEAKAFCAWLSDRAGFHIRLPSEAEWECACRAGSNTEYCYGDSQDSLGEYATYATNFNGRSMSVKTRRANDWGIFDLHGSVWEWCEDSYHKDYDCAPQDGTPWTTQGVTVDGFRFRSCRGGSWGDTAVSCRSSTRRGQPEWYRWARLGLRPAFVTKVDD